MYFHHHSHNDGYIIRPVWKNILNKILRNLLNFSSLQSVWKTNDITDAELDLISYNLCLVSHFILFKKHNFLLFKDVKADGVIHLVGFQVSPADSHSKK